MPGTDNNDVFDIARGIKTDNPTVPIVVLTPFSHGIRKSMQNMDFSIFDYVFCWLGNTDLLLSIIKLIEDKMNLENDVAAFFLSLKIRSSNRQSLTVAYGIISIIKI